MFESLGRFMFRRRRWVLAGAAVAVVVAVLWGTGVFGSLAGADGDARQDALAQRTLAQPGRVHNGWGGGVAGIHRHNPASRP